MKKKFLVIIFIFLCVSKAYSLPAKYDLRDYNRVSGVKDQRELETCWAFAVLGACESNYLTQNFGTSIDLSEQNLIDSVKHDFSFPTSKSRADPFSAAAVLTRQTRDSFMLRDIYFLSKNNPFDSLDNEARKKLIMQHGALYASIYLDHTQIAAFRNHKVYFDKSKGKNINHDVLIAGWDDEFPLFYFSPRPSQNGAWLVKDSWGNDKYFWLSYEQPISGGAAFILEKSSPDSRIYYHDELGYCGAVPYNWAANVFRIREDCEYIKAISFYTSFNDTSYELYVYEFGSVFPDSPVNGHLMAKLHGEFELAGYHTVNLPEELSMWHGEYFSVVLKLGRKVMAVETKRENYSDNAVINHNESCFSTDGKHWTDGSSIDSNACIKVFTVIRN